jgi:hypothetical protein
MKENGVDRWHPQEGNRRLSQGEMRSGAAGIGGPAVHPVERSDYLKATYVMPPESSPAP